MIELPDLKDFMQNLKDHEVLKKEDPQLKYQMGSKANQLGEGAYA